MYFLVACMIMADMHDRGVGSKWTPGLKMGGFPYKLQIHALEVHDRLGAQMDPKMRVTLVFKDAVLRLRWCAVNKS